MRVCSSGIEARGMRAEPRWCCLPMTDPKDADVRSVYTHAERWIELVSRAEQEVTAAEVETWDKAKPFEWV